MQTQFIFRLVFSLFTIKYVNAEAVTTRGDFHQRVYKGGQDSLIINPGEVSSFLAEQGYAVDQYSEVFVHEEEGYIDLSCFDCVITHLPHNLQKAGPGNDFIIEN